MVKKIVFASCMSAVERPEQPVWRHVLAMRPDVLLLLGDLVYMDWGCETRRKLPPWKERLQDDETGLGQELRSFQVEMHRRYAAQWDQPDFKALMVYMDNPARGLYVTRDDHDTAWNNCTTAGNPELPEFVPPEVKQASDRLFRQFVRKLHDPESYQGEYPPLDEPDLPSPLPNPKIETVPVVLLDQRSHRTEISAHSPSLLGSAQAQALDAAVRAEQGLMIVAGATPMRHGRDGGWFTTTIFNNPKHAYPEYAQFTAAARDTGRPILYLGGDVHENRYDGPVEPGSSILQVLSSGAAQPPIFSKCLKWLKIDPQIGKNKSGNFGLLTLEGFDASALAGQVKVELFRNTEKTHGATLSLQRGYWVPSDAPTLVDVAGQAA